MVSSKKKKTSTAGSSKKRSGRADTRKKVAGRASTEQQVGMPAQDSIISEATLKSPKGNVYRILKTNEMDDYDEPVLPEGRRRKR